MGTAMRGARRRRGKVGVKEKMCREKGTDTQRPFQPWL